MKKPILQLLGIAIMAISFVLLFQLKKEQTTSREEEPEEQYEEKEEESGADKQLAAFFQARAYPDPTNLNEKFLRGWEQAMQIRNNQQVSRTTQSMYGSWNAIGPDMTIGGRILSIAIDPNNVNNVFIGSASGGIWKSVNAGGSWTRVETGLPVLGVASIAFQPGNSNLIIAGTGEVYRADTSNIGFNVWKARGTYGTGIIRSSDGGVTWTNVLNKVESNLFGVQKIKFDPVNSNIVYACTTDGIFKSTNAGATWGATAILNAANVSPVPSELYVSDLVINPANTNVMVAAIGNLSNTNKGIYRTINGGSSWTRVTSALPSSSAMGGYTKLENAGSGVLYASIGGNDAGENELYMSTDFGQTWFAKASSHHCSYQFWFSHTLAINPSNSNEIIIAGVNMYKYTSTSTTGSAGSKTQIGSTVHADYHDIKYQPGSSSIFYVANDGGMYKTTNNGSTFTRINTGLSATQFYASFAVSPSDPLLYIGGLQDNGVVRFDGSSWNSVIGGDGGPSAFHPTNGAVVYASNDARKVGKSTNFGSSFTNTLSSWAFNADDRTGFMAPIAVSKSDPNYVYVASDNLHKTTNAGTSWTNPDWSTATNYIEARYKTAIALAVSPTNRDEIYVSTSPFSQKTDNSLNITGAPNVLRSTNGGTSFGSIKSNLPDRFVMDFAISETNDDSVFVVLGGYGTSHVWVRNMTNGTWTSIGAGLPDVPFNAIMIDPLNPQILYAGCDIGVYVSPNRGATWYDFSDGLWDVTQVMDIQMTSDNQLIIATHGKGVFRGARYSSILPVTFLSFSGKVIGTRNQLEWRVSDEVNLSHYELERSEEGIRYTTVGRMTASNSRAERVYSLGETVNNSTSYYYRVKSVNSDGTYKYSNVVYLRRNAKDEIQVLRNPFSSSLDLRLNLAEDSKLQLNMYDASGKWIKSEVTSVPVGGFNYSFRNLSALSPGIYYVQAILNNNRKWSQKVIKQ